ncbi:hypothetical protein DSM110093_01971 [Sulfitobacter sp. DSM 110093]|uniref:hypothetical protein n=1 Tax=Sulfitobacter sp. DSM 110093 TaxID=2883127 RepID=UPI001FABFF6A|nr:hypothetical protein [Sulfitobacter sp. DSM 110093]UOA32187.1 hypothetical protein DSM110093_01971 [Sulfitobacter sp. DSM 110093]
MVGWNCFWVSLGSVILSSWPLVLQASSVCTAEQFSNASEDLPDEILIENGSAAISVARVLGCEMPFFISEEVPVKTLDGKEVGVLMGVVGAIGEETSKSSDYGYWLVKEGDRDFSYAVPSMDAAIDEKILDKPALQLESSAAYSSELSTMIDKIGGSFLAKNGYSSAAQVVAVNAGFWPSKRYAVTFLSEPDGGIVHRGKVPKEPTEWAVVIESSSLSNYSIISPTDEVCSYEDAEVRVYDTSQSVTFFCTFTN